MLRRSRRVLIILETTRSLVFEEKSERVSQDTVGSDLFQGKSERMYVDLLSIHQLGGKMSKRLGGIIDCKYKTCLGVPWSSV